MGTENPRRFTEEGGGRREEGGGRREEGGGGGGGRGRDVSNTMVLQITKRATSLLPTAADAVQSAHNLV